MVRTCLIRLMMVSVLLIPTQWLAAQTYEEFLRQHQEDFQQFKKEQEQLMHQLEQDYRQWVKAHDADFAAYLEKEWKQFQVFAGKPVPDKPKPGDVPVYTPPERTPSDPIRKLPVVPSSVSPAVAPPVIIRLPLIQQTEPEVDIPEDAFAVPFCGAKVYLDIDRELSAIRIDGSGNQAIAGYWKKASGKNCTTLVNQLLEAKESFNLNDYGYYMLLEETAKTVYPMDNQLSERLLLQWFLMIRSGYDTRIAYNNEEMAILIPSFNTLYGTQYITLNGINYYLLSPFGSNNILTYDQKYDAAHTPIDFGISRPLSFGIKAVKKTVAFEYGEKRYAFELQYDPGVIVFFANYPQVDPEVYFNAAISRDLKESLALALNPLLVNLSEPEAINFLLHFVQTAFEYKTDPEQFDHEKFFFAEEVIYYPASDCEDRSVLFSYLVRELLGMKVVGLEYPGHMATAVHFSTEIPGDYITWQGERYTLADATYINAPFGRTMPIIGDQPAKVIPLKNSGYTWLNRDRAWAMATDAGINKAHYFQSLVFDTAGNVFLTGYFNDELKLGSKTFHGERGAQSFVVASLTREGNVAWADHIPASGNAAGLAISLDQTGDLFIAGSFSGTMGSMNIGSHSDLFVTRYTASGKRLWIKPAGLDTLPPDACVTYAVNFSKRGEKHDLRLVESSPSFSDYGLFVTDDAVVYTGLMQNTLVPAVASPAINATSDFDYTELLKREYDKFVSVNTDRAAAGLFAIASLIRSAGIIIPGYAVQQAFDRYNPSFKKKNPEFYENVGKISFLRNANNIISIVTDQGKDIVINKMKISNHAQIRVSMISDMETMVEALHGVKVGKLFIWYNLNSVKVFSQTGDMVFDYDNDHTQTSINIQKDILN